MLDSEIDIKNKEMPTEIEEITKDFLKFFYMNRHLICICLIKHLEDLLNNNFLIDIDGKTLKKKSRKV